MSLILPSFESYGISDIGRRSNNEDVWAELPEDHFYVVADGMGGHLAGEIAAREGVYHLCDTIEKYLRKTAHPTVIEAEKVVRQAFIDSNRWIRTLSAQHPDFSGMGTTLCAALIIGHEMVYGHVGDSRIYRFRNRLERLTNDHSLRQEMLSKGQLTEKNASDFPYRNVITRALGIAPHVEPEMGVTTILPGDLYFLSSDGLHDPLTDKEIETILRQSETIRHAAVSLVEAAKNAGGQDNITILIFKTHDEQNLSR